MKRLFLVFAFLLFAHSAFAQTSGSTAPPPPYCTSANPGAIYTDTGTSPATVYTCSYYNLAWQWVVNPSYGGLVSYPTVPTTCSGSLPVFLAGWPNTQEYVCVNGVPDPIGGAGSGVGTFSAPSGSWPSWLVPTVTNPTTTPSLAVAAGIVPTANGGTGSSTAAQALANLGGVSTMQTTPQTMAGPLNSPAINSVLSSSAYPSLASALAVAGSSQVTLDISTSMSITGTETIPSNVSVKVENGAQFTGSGTLIIAGPFSAGLYQAFASGVAVYFTGGSSTMAVLPQWFGATGDSRASGAATTSGNATVTIETGSGRQVFSTGDTVTIVGAGVSGVNLTTSVTGYSSTTITVVTAPSTTVSNTPIYTNDDTAAMQLWANSVRGSQMQSPTIGYDLQAVQGPSHLYIPKGQYVVGCSVPLRIYTSILLEGEAANTNHSSRLIQCNPNVTAVRLSPLNEDVNGNVFNTSGNEIIRGLAMVSAYSIGGVFTPAISFDPAPNLWGDTEIDHIYCNVGGSCLGAGFATTTTASAGASSITLGDGSVFITGEQITIAGAGTSGAALTTTISGCGTVVCGNTVSISPSIVTTIAGAAVTPIHDDIGLKVASPELDTGYRFFSAQNNATVGLDISGNTEIYGSTSAAIYVSTPNPPSVHIEGGRCYGCGNRNSGTNVDNYSVYVANNGGTQTGDVVIHGFKSYRLSSPNYLGAGGVLVAGVQSAIVEDSQFWDVASGSAYPALRITGTPIVKITGNVIYTTTTTTGSLISTCCTPGTDATDYLVTGNTLWNNTGSSYTGNAIDADMVPSPAATILGNVFLGTFTTRLGSNLSNNNSRQDSDNTAIGTVSHYGTGAPVSSMWQVGDTIWNSAPSLGSPLGWINTVAGTPGTWQPFGGVGVALSTAGPATQYLDKTGNYSTPSITTSTNCSSAASPAVCGSAAAGSVLIAVGVSNVQVSTSAVTAASQIFFMPDASLSLRLGVTCNTTLTPFYISIRSPGSGFTIATTAAVSVNPMCGSYMIIN